jgi:hypothetical protein
MTICVIEVAAMLFSQPHRMPALHWICWRNLSIPRDLTHLGGLPPLEDVPDASNHLLPGSATDIYQAFAYGQKRRLIIAKCDFGHSR